MNNSAKWGIILGAGIPGVLILIGVLGLLIKFFMKRCRKKAWDDISSLPTKLDVSQNNIGQRRFVKRKSSDRQPLYQSTTNNALEVSDTHISIPIDENELPPGQRPTGKVKEPEHTVVQIQRERLNRLKADENRLKPAVNQTPVDDDIQRAIDQAQKEFEESV